MKLGAVVGGDSTNEMHFTFDELDHFSIELIGGSGSKFPNQGVACLAFDERHDAVGVVVAAHDGIDFPIAEARPVLGP